MQPKSQFQLGFEDLILKVHLGVTPEERKYPQDVTFTLSLTFLEPLPAQTTDLVNDTIDYGVLCETVKEICKNREFNLIESLGHDVFEGIRKFSKGKVRAKLRVHKLNPPIRKLKGGAFFTIEGDL